MGWWGCGLQDGDGPLDAINDLLNVDNPYNKDEYWNDEVKRDEVDSCKFLTAKTINIFLNRKYGKEYKKIKEQCGYCDNWAAQNILAIADFLLKSKVEIPQQSIEIIKEVLEYEYRCPWGANEIERREALDDFKSRFNNLDDIEFNIVIKQTRVCSVPVKAKSKLEAINKIKQDKDIKLDWYILESEFK